MSYSFWAVLSFLLLSLFFIASLIEYRLSKWVHYLLIVTLLASIILILPYRGFGLDFENYRDFYQKSANYRVEPLYELIMHFFRTFYASFEFFYLCIYLAAIGLFYYSFRSVGNSLKLWFVFLVLYYFTYFDVTRAFITSAILLVALQLLYERRLTIFFLILPIGAFIHYSFIITIPLFFMLRFKLTINRFFLLLFFAVGFSFLLKNFIYIYYELSTFQGTNFNFIHRGLRYIFERSAEPDEYFNSIHWFLWHSIVLYISVLSFIFSILFLRKDEKSYPGYLSYLIKFNCFGVVLFALFYSLGSIVMAARVNQLLSIGLPVLIITYCYGTEKSVIKSKVNYKYLFLCALLFMISLLPFSYIARVYHPGAMLYYGNIF